jgi:hypothetical protein
MSLTYHSLNCDSITVTLYLLFTFDVIVVGTMKKRRKQIKIFLPAARKMRSKVFKREITSHLHIWMNQII